MAPKRKAKAAGKAAAGGKKKKVAAKDTPEEDVEVSVPKDAINKLKAADAKKPKKSSSRKADKMFPYSGAEVHEDYDCMLNQTNIGNNNNKFYIIQVLNVGQYYTWNRWGRVGENGQNSIKGPFPSPEPAIKDFEKKFKDKTRNAWANRASFAPVAGKYTLIEMDDDDGDDDDGLAEKLAQLEDAKGDASSAALTAASTLDKPTQELIRLIFDHDMFKQAMATMEIDVKKMPLGKLSKAQVAKGFEALEAIEDAIEHKRTGANLADLTSKFYTIIPHNFGRQRPPVINTLEVIRKKYDMLAVLGDIVIAQTIAKDAKQKSITGGKKQLPNPIDVNYESLTADLEHIDKKSEEFKILETYTKQTSGGSWFRSSGPKIKEIWKVNRHNEDERFAAHASIKNRKLLWHGTNVAVVAAIMKSGLRIMPHSGGRVGKGIYFASENSKSAGYVGCVGKTGIMFLTEVALGKEHHIDRDDSSLRAAPKGYDCVVAKGWTEPDASKDTKLNIDGNDVIVPQGAPVKVPKFAGSSFSQSEYLIYKESQHRIRYLLRMEF